jgi:mono/diheme cytochrome c family protein
MQHVFTDQHVARVEVYLDDAQQPFQTLVPPATLELDTAKLDDGPHTLRILAYDTLGHVGRRTVPFVVQNGPGITVTGLRPEERVAGRVELEINAFGGNEPFDPIRAESSGPIPVWMWVITVLVSGWAVWYGLAFFAVPQAYASTPTYATNPVAAANVPMSPYAPPAVSSGKNVAGFDYSASGQQVYTANCAACHGADGAGTPGAFPPLAGDPVVTANDPATHIGVVLKGLSGKAIHGTTYASQMPSFAQLSDADVAAVIDHERTSWGNRAPTITPDIVKRAR